MDINTLKTFIEVYRTRHFGKAADNLFVTQSTVSARIRQLEEDLNVKLFFRDRNNIQLTPSGQRFLKHAEAIISSWNRSLFEINIEDDKRLPIVIAGVPSLWEIYLDNWLLKVRENYPDICLIAETLSGETIIRQLLDHSIDMGFTYEFPQVPGISINESLSFNLILVSSQKDITLESALRDNYIYVDWGTSFSYQHSEFFPDAPAPELRIAPGQVARKFIRAKGGAAYLPEPMTRNDLKKERLFKVKNAPEINRKSFVVFPENSERLDLIEKLISLNHSAD